VTPQKRDEVLGALAAAGTVVVVLMIWMAAKIALGQS
jgi:hypothetical protein